MTIFWKSIGTIAMIALIFFSAVFVDREWLLKNETVQTTINQTVPVNPAPIQQTNTANVGNTIVKTKIDTLIFNKFISDTSKNAIIDSLTNVVAGLLRTRNITYKDTTVTEDSLATLVLQTIENIVFDPINNYPAGTFTRTKEYVDSHLDLRIPKIKQTITNDSWLAWITDLRSVIAITIIAVELILKL